MHYRRQIQKKLVSPQVTVPTLDPAATKAGETLLAQSLESHREICKTMISVTTASLAAYIGLLSLVGEKARLAAEFQAATITACLPVASFAAAASFYVCGYFHHLDSEAGKVLRWLREKNAEEILNAIRCTVARRREYLWAGNIAYWHAVAVALYMAFACMRPNLSVQ